jgi:uncharacterized protein DUF6364
MRAKTKLTLSIEDAVVLRATRYAKQQGLSISEMVEAYKRRLAAKYR